MFEALAAFGAGAAGIDHAPDADMLTRLEFCDFGANGRDDACDLMAGHHGKNRAAPFIAGLMHVGVADAAESDVNGDIEITGRAAINRIWRERCFGGCGCVGFGSWHF